MEYKIYQINRESPDYMRLSFMSLRHLNGENPKLSNYACVYSGTIDNSDNPLASCESLYMKFNNARPEDFKGHSLSVSDIIQLGDAYYYCDSYGFTEVNVE